MITLPKTKRDPKKVEGFCKCRPVCKSRRREWQGRVQLTSEELLLCRKPLPECFRRRPREVYPNCPCPLHGRSKHVTINERDAERKAKVVRICQAPLDLNVETPYLDYIRQGYKLGALPLSHKFRCTFCDCGVCCGAGASNYVPLDAERAARRRAHMREFDRRVRGQLESRAMYGDE